MRWSLAAHVPVLTLALAACGSSPDGAGAASPRATTSASGPASPQGIGGGVPTSTPSATRSATPTTRVRDCFDGDCLLKVSKPVDIRLNAKKYYYPEMSIVTVDAESITYTVDYPHGGGAQQVLGPGGSGSFGFRSYPQVEVALVSIKKGTALVSISPGKRP